MHQRALRLDSCECRLKRSQWIIAGERFAVESFVEHVTDSKSHKINENSTHLLSLSLSLSHLLSLSQLLYLPLTHTLSLSVLWNQMDDKIQSRPIWFQLGKILSGPIKIRNEMRSQFLEVRQIWPKFRIRFYLKSSPEWCVTDWQTVPIA